MRLLFCFKHVVSKKYLYDTFTLAATNNYVFVFLSLINLPIIYQGNQIRSGRCRSQVSRGDVFECSDLFDQQSNLNLQLCKAEERQMILKVEKLKPEIVLTFFTFTLSDLSDKSCGFDGNFL